MNSRLTCESKKTEYDSLANHCPILWGQFIWGGAFWKCHHLKRGFYLIKSIFHPLGFISRITLFPLGVSLYLTTFLSHLLSGSLWILKFWYPLIAMNKASKKVHVILKWLPKCCTENRMHVTQNILVITKYLCPDPNWILGHWGNSGWIIGFANAANNIRKGKITADFSFQFPFIKRKINTKHPATEIK